MIDVQEVERIVRSAYQNTLRDRWLDEADIECMELAINQQVTLLILDACLKNRVLLNDKGATILAQATSILNYCLQELGIDNPYPVGKAS
jgi:predicted nucleic acid-binding protein